MVATRPLSIDISDASGPRPPAAGRRRPDRFGLIRRYWWLLAGSVAVGVAGAALVTLTPPRVYESSASVLVQPTGSGPAELNLDTEAELVRSTAVATTAAVLLRTTAPPETLVSAVDVRVPANTSVLLIRYAADRPRAARAGAQAFAEAYLRNRADADRAELANRMAALDARIKQLNTSLAQVNGRLGGLRQDSADRANLESQRQATVGQIATLTAQLNQLSGTAIGAGKIIRDAPLPASPSLPELPRDLAGGALLGLLTGVAAAVLRERLDRRVRRAADLTRRCDLPVLAAVPARVPPPLDDVYAPLGTGGRIFNRLRNEVLASIPAATTADPRALLHGQVVVVAGASRGPASTLVAANLAAAFSRTGAETVLVCAHLPDSLVDAAPVTRLLTVRATPGLSDVLAGRTSLARAAQRAPRHPSLRVLTTGGTASAGGLLQSQALRDTLAAVRARAAYVVIEAPSMAASADAQSLASLADAAILAVELRRTSHAEVLDATQQLRRVGTPLLGAVVLPKLTLPAQAPPVVDDLADDEDELDPLDLDPLDLVRPDGTGRDRAELAGGLPEEHRDGPDAGPGRPGTPRSRGSLEALPGGAGRPTAARRVTRSDPDSDAASETLLVARIPGGKARGRDARPAVMINRVDDTNLHRTIAELTDFEADPRADESDER